MGASMTGVIEYLDEKALELTYPKYRPEGLGWDNDQINGFIFDADKDYEFFCAIAGVRCGKPAIPLIKPRGLPERMSIYAAINREDLFCEEVCGWLFWSEIQNSINHSRANRQMFGPQLNIALMVMDLLQQKLGDKNVRMIFDIDSP